MRDWYSLNKNLNLELRICNRTGDALWNLVLVATTWK